VVVTSRRGSLAGEKRNEKSKSTSKRARGGPGLYVGEQRG
jgi:hypothetical protein